MRNRMTRIWGILSLVLAALLIITAFFRSRNQVLEAPAVSRVESIGASGSSATYHSRLLELKRRSHAKTLVYTDVEVEEWREEFPWEPTTDPDVVITQDILDSTYAEPEVTNHGFLTGFFKNEARFTPQFKKFYEIVCEYGRSDNPVAIAQSFQNLWSLHRILKYNPDETVMNSDGSPSLYQEPWESGAWKPLTYGVWAEHHWGSIGSHLHSQADWPEKDPEQLPPPEVEKVTQRLFEEVTGMDTIPDPGFAYLGGYEDALQVGDAPLVPRIGWQAAHDAWEESVKDQVFDFAYLIDPEGKHHPLGKDSDGNFVSPLTAEQIEQINARRSGD